MNDLFSLSVHDKHTLDYYFIKKIIRMNSQNQSLMLVELGGAF